MASPRHSTPHTALGLADTPARAFMNEQTPTELRVKSLTPNTEVEDRANNDHAESWDHLCGPDPAWRKVLEESDD